MNLMYLALNPESRIKDEKFNAKLQSIKDVLKKTKIKISHKYQKVKNVIYYKNCLPFIEENRDLLTKPTGFCKMRINWKGESFSGLSTDEIMKILPEFWGFSVSIVDANYKRNKYKNKTDIWVVFDKKEKAAEAMALFNKMFYTEIELDTIDEYKKFIKSPDKRVLSFDQIVPNAYELYDEIDKHTL